MKKIKNYFALFFLVMAMTSSNVHAQNTSSSTASIEALPELSGQNDHLQIEIKKHKKENEELKSAILLSEVDDYTKEAMTMDNAASLEQNYPNPFNRQTTVRYTIPPDCSSAILQISDKKGDVLKNYSISRAGKGELIINAGELEPGVYQNTLIVDGRKMDAKQMILFQ